MNKYLIYIKSHCEAKDYEDSCLADSKLEAALIFAKRIAKSSEDAWSAPDLLEYIEEDGIISGVDINADSRDLFASRECGNQLSNMENRNL